MKKMLDYQSPPAMPIVSERDAELFGIAGILATFATMWGALAALQMMGSGLGHLPYYSTGYLITAGYWWRALTRPTLFWSRMIWALSAAVQGSWLMWFILKYGREPDVWPAGMPVIVWWAFAAGISAFAFFHEPARPAA